MADILAFKKRPRQKSTRVNLSAAAVFINGKFLQKKSLMLNRAGWLLSINVNAALNKR